MTLNAPFQVDDDDGGGMRRDMTRSYCLYVADSKYLFLNPSSLELPRWRVWSLRIVLCIGVCVLL